VSFFHARGIELKRPNSNEQSLKFSLSALEKVQGLRLPVFGKILARDMRPFEKSVLLKIGLPPIGGMVVP